MANHSTVEADRQSTMSSFYRGRKDSFDALAGAGTAQPTIAPYRDHESGSGREKYDDASSFFQPQAQTRDRDTRIQPGQYGSYSQPLRGVHDGHSSVGAGGAYEEDDPAQDEGWDVYNDFNNKGPRYSEAFGTSLPTTMSSSNSQGYRQITPPKSAASESGYGGAKEVEMVTVPALGPDWKKSEIENMRSATHRNAAHEKRMLKVKGWWRDQYACCGGRGSRKVIVIAAFVLCILVGIILAITLPRVPGFQFNASTPLTNDTSSSLIPQFSRVPVNFTFAADLNIQIDTSSNIIPLDIKSIHADVFCLDTGFPVGNGTFNGIKIPAKTFQPVRIPVVFSYLTENATDTTWLQFYNACKNPSQYTDGIRPGFNLRVVLTSTIAGMIKKVVASTQISKVPCPFILPNTSA